MHIFFHDFIFKFLHFNISIFLYNDLKTEKKSKSHNIKHRFCDKFTLKIDLPRVKKFENR